MMSLNYTTHSMRRRRNTDQWECSLSHTDPVTGEAVRTYHTITGKTKGQEERARNVLIVQLEIEDGASASGMTVREFMEAFLAYKERPGTIEPSTVRSYSGKAKQMYRRPAMDVNMLLIELHHQFPKKGYSHAR